MIYRILTFLFFFSVINQCFSVNKNIPFHRTSTTSAFIENKGQIIDQDNKPNPAVLYLLNMPGFNVQLRKTGFSYDVYSRTSPPAALLKERGDLSADSSLLLQEKGLRDEVPIQHPASSIQYHRIDFEFLNANPNPVIETSDPSSDYRNYYTTGTPEKGATFVHSFQTIIYKDIYSNVDLEFIADPKSGFKYNFIVHPGGDLNSIRINISGPEIEVPSSGSLLLKTTIGTIEEKIPSCSFRLENTTIPVKVSFIRIKEGVYGFKLPSLFIAHSSLLIDPVPTRLWGSYFGGPGTEMDDYASGHCAKDSYGNIFLNGATNSTNNIATAGAHQTTYGGGQYDAFLVKFNSSGQVVWATYYGGAGDEMHPNCTADPFGNVVLCGETTSLTNISTAGSHQPGFGGGDMDNFLVKFNNNGIRIWGTYYGGAGEEEYSYCFADYRGNVYLCGETTSDTGISTPGAYQTTLNSIGDAYLVKFDSSGTRKWGTYYGGSHGDVARSCAADTNGNIVLSGSTASPDNIASIGAHQYLFGGVEDGFLVLFNAAGQRQWGTYYGGSVTDRVLNCTITNDGNIYACGETTSSNNIATSGSHQFTYGGGYGDAFLAKFNIAGVRQWGTYYGGAGYERSFGCVVDDSSFVFLYGETNSTDNIATVGSYHSVIQGPDDAFLAKFDQDGILHWGTYYGGEGGDDAAGCVISGDTIYMTGITLSTTGIATPGTHQTELDGPIDVYLVKFLDCYSPDTIDQITGTTELCAPYSGINYYISPMPYATSYIWEPPPGATIASGQGTDIVTVDFGSSAVSGFLKVHGVNACGQGEPNTLYITVHPRPVPVITGDTISCTGETETYFTQPGKISYQWANSPGSVITAGGTPLDDSITILWTTAGARWIGVSFTDTNNCIAVNQTVLNVTVADPAVVGITIAGPAGNICEGTQVMFTATPSNGGSAPSFQWKVNGIDVGGNNPNYTYFPLNGDLVTCVLTSSLPCILANPVTSNILSVTISNYLPVSVSISASSNPFCQGNSVTFTAIPVNGGIMPSYVWKVNGITMGTNNAVYSYVPLNGDVVSCVMNSNIACPTGNPATSNFITMAENTNSPVSISINASANPVCSGTSVTFQATPVNGGTIPFYQWKVNGLNAGSNLPTYTYTPVSGDLVTCILTSNAVCANGNPATSNTITMTVNPNMSVSITINTSANPVCAGSSVTFQANPINPGTSPVYLWKVNGSIAGTNSTIYSYIPLNGDLVTCTLTSNAICATGNPAVSNQITMTVNPVLPVSITVTASVNPVCSGLSVTYTAHPVNGGNSPLFQWKVNSLISGTNSPTYTYIPISGDQVICNLTSNVACPSGNPATSNNITMTVATTPVVTFTPCNDSITTTNAQPFKLKGGIPLGGTYSGPGVTNDILYPAIAGAGTKTINYSYSNSALCSATANLQFVILNPSFVICGTGLTDPRDNKTYPTVQIGSQCWLAEDLNYGTEIPSTQHQRDNCIPEKYHNPASSIQHPTSVYQWDEIMNYDEVVSNQGFCPPSWHVPTEAEWNTLFANYNNSGFAGSPLKYSGFSGFNALLNGDKYLNKIWDYQGFATFFWSSASHGATRALAHGMNDADPSVSLYSALRTNAFSVRCLKD